MDDFYVLNAPLLEDWILLHRGRLRERFLDALQSISSKYIEQGQPEQAIEHTRQLLAIEPWREAGHRQLMNLLAITGQRAAALTQYDICERVLAEELDVSPSNETFDLFTQIRDGKVSTNPVLSPARSTSQAPEHNLPAQSIPFVGRKNEIAKLTDLLSDTKTRLVTILGAGGMGKTRLALEVANSLLDSYQHNICFVSLAPLSEAESMVTAIAAALGYTFANDDRSSQQELLEHLRGRQMLLLLDNAEYLLDGVDLFTVILEAAPQVKLLVTSRERLRLAAETVYSLERLRVPSDDNTSTDASLLFIQSCQRLRTGFTPTGAEWTAVLQICQLVGGMPLGLLLAASWIEMFSVKEIAHEIENSLAFLSTALRDIPERQRSIQAVFESTLRRLSSAEQDALSKLSVFRGGFTRDAALSVAGASVQILTTLSHKALIRRNEHNRYEIHELLRQLAQEHLSEKQNEVYADHGAHYCRFLAEREDDLKGARQKEAVEALEAGVENIRLAWRWAVQERKIPLLIDAVQQFPQLPHHSVAEAVL